MSHYAPQIIWIVLVVLESAECLNKHGQPRGPFRFGYHLVGVAITVALLWWGGFFAGGCR